MILLNSTDSLQVLLAGTVTTNQCVLYAAYADMATDASTLAPGAANGLTNNTTAVSWVSAPASGDVRQIKYLSLYNADTVSVTATVRINDGTNTRILCKVLLATGERLEYDDCVGFRLISASGALAAGAATIADGDKGDITVSASGTVWTIDSDVVSTIRSVPQNSQSAAYTLVLGDAGKHIYHPSTDANARTFTIPANSSVAYAIGTALTFINETSQVVSIAITADTLVLGGTGTTGTRSLAQYGVATALKVTSTRWIITGTGLT